jgi:hypothetical protein
MKNGCKEKTRMCLVVPCSDINPDGTPGLAGISLCGEHLEESMLRYLPVATTKR